MPPFEGPPKKSIGTRAAAQNKRAAAVAANKAKQNAIRTAVVKALNDMGIKHNPDAPTKNLRDVLEANIGISDNVPMAGEQGDFILPRKGETIKRKRGGTVGKKRYARGGGIRKPKQG